MYVTYEDLAVYDTVGCLLPVIIVGFAIWSVVVAPFAIVGVLATHAADFAISFACLLLGTAVLLLGLFDGLLPLVPLSFPLFAYALATLSGGFNAYLNAATDDTWAWVVVRILVALAWVAATLALAWLLFGIAGENKSGRPHCWWLTFLLTFPLWWACFDYDRADKVGTYSSGFFYTMRVVCIAAVVAAVVWLVVWLRDDEARPSCRLDAPGNLLGLGLGCGVAALVGAVGLVGCPDAVAFALLVGCLAACVAASAWYANQPVRLAGSAVNLVIPLLVMMACYALQGARDTMPCELSGLVFGVLRNDAASGLSALVASGLSLVGQAVGAVAKLAMAIAGLVLDQPEEAAAVMAGIQVPAQLSLVVLLGLAVLSTWLGQHFAGPLMARMTQVAPRVATDGQA